VEEFAIVGEHPQSEEFYDKLRVRESCDGTERNREERKGGGQRNDSLACSVIDRAVPGPCLI